jgi:predicted Zn-ribbon and HTH transcriptional regulator
VPKRGIGRRIISMIIDRNKKYVIVREKFWFKCQRCKYEWEARTQNVPKRCPSCQSYRWTGETEDE